MEGLLVRIYTIDLLSKHLLNRYLFLEEGRIINIYGPSGLRQYLRIALGTSFSMMNYSIRVHELVTTDMPPLVIIKISI